MVAMVYKDTSYHLRPMLWDVYIHNGTDNKQGMIFYFKINHDECYQFFAFFKYLSDQS